MNEWIFFQILYIIGNIHSLVLTVHIDVIYQHQGEEPDMQTLKATTINAALQLIKILVVILSRAQDSCLNYKYMA